MPTPLGLSALETVRNRLRSIRKDDQYNTDVGEHAVLGPASLSGDDIEEAVFVEFAQEAAAKEGKDFIITRTFTATGIAKRDPLCEKGVTAELLLADMKRALFKPYITKPEGTEKILGPISYQTSRLLPRADGNQFESVELTGSMTYTEIYGDPYHGK